MSFQSAALLLAWVAIALLGLALAGILRQIHLMEEAHSRPPARTGPEVGKVAPKLHGGEFSRSPVLLLFLDKDCQSCESVLPHMSALANRNPAADVVALYRGDVGGGNGDGIRVLGQQTAAFGAYNVVATPFAVMVDRSGVVTAAAPVGSTSAMREFVASAGVETEVAK